MRWTARKWCCSRFTTTRRRSKPTSRLRTSRSTWPRRCRCSRRASGMHCSALFPDPEHLRSKSMNQARHPKPPDVAGLSLEQIAERYVARFKDRRPDWNAFEDAKLEGYKRAQHRFIGAGGSGKHSDQQSIPPRGFTLSIMYVEPGQGNAAHTHEVEEVFFVLRGFLDVFLEDESGRHLDIRLGP